MTNIIQAILLCCIAAPAFAQYTEKIETDRPDQTESPVLIMKNSFQAEFGLNKEIYQDENYRIVHPAALLKYGLGDRAELRLETVFATDYTHLVSSTKTNTYLEPVEVGAKLRLWEEKGLLPKTSLIAYVGLPFAASSRFRPESATFSSRLCLQHTLNEKMALGYNVGVETGGGDETAFLYTLAPGINIGERWYAYGEIFGYLKNTSEHFVDGGIAFYPSANTKVDLSAGTTINHAAMKNYVALGFSFRMLPRTKK